MSPPVLVASYPVYDNTADLVSLVSPSFSPAANELIVIKAVTSDASQTFTPPTDTAGLIWDQLAQISATSFCTVALFTATVVSAPGPMTITLGVTGVVKAHSMVVERWANARTATPNLDSSSGIFTQVSATFTQDPAATSIVTWMNGDWNAVDGAGRAYNTTSSVPAEDGYATNPLYTVYYASQAGTGTPFTYGLTAPSGQRWQILAVELLEADLPPAAHLTGTGTVTATGAVTSSRLWSPSTVPATLNLNTGNYTLATGFSLSSAALLVAIWFYSPPGAVILPSRCAIWDTAAQTVVDGSDLTSPPWSGGAGSGWVYVPYRSYGVILAPAANYQVAVYSAGGQAWFGVTDSYWTIGDGAAGIVSGPITAPDEQASATGQDSYHAGAWSWPDCDGYGGNYWVDPEVEPVLPPPPSGTVVALFTRGISMWR